MTIRRGGHHHSYTKICNAIAQDLSLSLEARGLWLYLVTQPLTWTILPPLLAKQQGVGRDKMYRFLKELIVYGVCTKAQSRKKLESGKWVAGNIEYVIYDEVQNVIQDEPAQLPGSRDAGSKETYIRNKRLEEIKSISKDIPKKSSKSKKETDGKETDGEGDSGDKDSTQVPDSESRLAAKRLARKLEESIVSWKGSLMKSIRPDLWYKDIEKLLKSVSEERIRCVIFWLATDDNDARFWRSNIRSGNKLYKKFDVLEAKALSRPKKKEDENIDLFLEGF